MREVLTSPLPRFVPQRKYEKCLSDLRIHFGWFPSLTRATNLIRIHWMGWIFYQVFFPSLCNKENIKYIWKRKDNSTLCSHHLLAFCDLSHWCYFPHWRFKADAICHGISLHKYFSVLLFKLKKFSFLTTILSSHLQR